MFDDAVPACNGILVLLFSSNLEMAPALRVEVAQDHSLGSSGLSRTIRATEFCAFSQRLVLFNSGGIVYFLARRPGSNGSITGLCPWTWIYACIALDDTDELHPGRTNGTRCC